jgi:hypothetical protein
MWGDSRGTKSCDWRIMTLTYSQGGIRMSRVASMGGGPVHQVGWKMEMTALMRDMSVR